MSLLPPMSRQSAKFDVPGKTYSGSLVEIGEEQQSSTYDPNGPGKPAFWDDEKTRPKMQRRFLIQCTPDPAIEGDDGIRAIFAIIDSKNGSLYSAIHGALANATATGGTLTVTFTGTDPLSKNPQNPRKLYTASYTDPTPGQILGGAQQSTEQPGQPAAQQAQSAAPAGPPEGIDAAAWAAMPDEIKQQVINAQKAASAAPF